MEDNHHAVNSLDNLGTNLLDLKYQMKKETRFPICVVFVL
jgi:hypothetical protein